MIRIIHEPTQDTAPSEKPARLPVEEMAMRRLRSECSYPFAFRDISLHFADGVLTVTGRVATFYLKQMLQTYLLTVDGVERVDNQADVVSSTGLSSTRPR